MGFCLSENFVAFIYLNFSGASSLVLLCCQFILLFFSFASKYLA